jgi:malonyl-CoA/methylmalonyl-CoA synthetase
MTVPLIARAEAYGPRTAVVDPDGSHSFDDLLRASSAVAARLLKGEHDLAEQRVAFLVPPGFAHVATQWGIWRAGGIAVPLAMSHPPAELAHVLDDCDATLVVAHPSCDER